MTYEQELALGMMMAKVLEGKNLHATEKLLKIENHPADIFIRGILAAKYCNERTDIADQYYYLFMISKYGL